VSIIEKVRRRPLAPGGEERRLGKRPITMPLVPVHKKKIKNVPPRAQKPAGINSPTQRRKPQTCLRTSAKERTGRQPGRKNDGRTIGVEDLKERKAVNACIERKKKIRPVVQTQTTQGKRTRKCPKRKGGTHKKAIVRYSSGKKSATGGGGGGGGANETQRPHALKRKDKDQTHKKKKKEAEGGCRNGCNLSKTEGRQGTTRQPR